MCHQQQTYVRNVVILGAGIAGLRAALAAKQRGCDVVVLSKGSRNAPSAMRATDGINATFGTVDPEDSWQQHVADSLRAGQSLADAEAMQILAQEAPHAVLELASWGCDFARTPDGKLDQRLLDGHTWRRTCYVQDETGQAIHKTLLQKVEAAQIAIHEDQFVTRLLVYEAVCYGVLAFDLRSGQRILYLADAVILATGSHTLLWRRNGVQPAEEVGDGMALAIAAGCQLIDMEFVQFEHPPTAHPSRAAEPIAHYALGGIKVEPATHATNLAGLYAVGEVTGGLHGASCLAGNPLSEAVVFGKRAGEAAATYADLLIAQLRVKAPIAEAHDELNRLAYSNDKTAQSLQQALQDTLRTSCGMVRNEAHLQAGLQRIAELSEAAEEADGSEGNESTQALAQALNLRFALCSAEATLSCALKRQESRGVHQRQDFPEVDPALQVHFVVS